jgi:hypothetical protein
LNILVPQTGQVPLVAGLPFFILMEVGFFISLLARHFIQYACILFLLSFSFLRSRLAQNRSRVKMADGRITIFENRLYICRFRDTSDSRLITPNVALCTIQLLNKLFLYAVDIAVRNGLSSPQPYRTVQENYPRGLATVEHLLRSLSVEEVSA